MPGTMKPTFMSIPVELRRETLIHYLLISASDFEAPKGIHATPFDRPLLVFCDSKADIGSIPLMFGQLPENRPPTVGQFQSFKLPETTMNIMLASKLLYSEVSSLLFQVFALIPPRTIFRFVHWIPFVPNENAQTFDLIRHLQLRIAFSLDEKGAMSFFHDARNLEDVTRFKEFREWFGGLRTVRLQIGFRGGKEEVEETKRIIVRRIMRCVEVFRGIEVFLFAEPAEKLELGSSVASRKGLRERTIKDIIGECQGMISKQSLTQETAERETMDRQNDCVCL